MFDPIASFLNTIESLDANIVGSNLTLNTIWLVCGIVTLTGLKLFQSLFFYNTDATNLTEDARNVTESVLTLNRGRIQPRRIQLIQFADTAQVDKVLLDLLRDLDWFPVIGLDCEMRQRAKKAPLVVMMQFANRFGDCVLLRFPENITQFSNVFLNIITDPYLWKVGVGVYDDLQNFVSKYPDEKIIPQGSFDLRILAEDLEVKERGLKKLGRTLLGIETYDKRTEHDRWDAVELTPAQIKYAATDALLGVALFERFFEMSLRRIDATVAITEEVKKEEMSNFLHKYFDKKSQQYRGKSVVNTLICFCNWLSNMIFGRV